MGSVGVVGRDRAGRGAEVLMTGIADRDRRDGSKPVAAPPPDYAGIARRLRELKVPVAEVRLHIARLRVAYKHRLAGRPETKIYRGVRGPQKHPRGQSKLITQGDWHDRPEGRAKIAARKPKRAVKKGARRKGATAPSARR